MLRRATDNDRHRLLAYLRREPEFNLFIIGDILNYGFLFADAEYFLEEDGDACQTVLMRFRDALIPYTHDDAHDLSASAERINTYLERPGKWTVHGKKEIIERVKPLLCRSPRRDHELFFCVCRQLHAEVPLGQLPLVQIATPDDAEEVGKLLCSIAEFSQTDYSHLRGEIEERKTTISVIREAASDRMVSTANYVAESDGAAMIIGVATIESERGKGYASACIYRLLEDLQAKGKSACLFFDNPAAGNIYHRLGFEDIGMWRMLHFEGRNPF